MGYVLGQYEILPNFSGEGYFMADIRHRKGETLTPVGNVYAAPEPGEGGAAVTSVRLYLRTDVRYDAKTGETKAVSFPESPLTSGSNKDLLYGLFHRRQADLPYYPPELPEAILGYLLDNGYCAEPLRMQIFHKAKTGELTQVKGIDRP